MPVKTKRSARSKAAKRAARIPPVAARKAARKNKPLTFAKPYDAKRFAGTVKAFAEVTADEMRAWRDDR